MRATAGRGLVYRSVATLALIAIAIAGFIFFWNRIVYSPAASPASDSGFIVAYSSTPPKEATLWVTLEAGRPDLPVPERQTGIRLSFEFEGTSEQVASFGYVFGGGAAEMIGACTDQTVTIVRDVAFDQLPLYAREGAVSSVKSTAAGPDAMSDISAVQELQGDTFTLVTVERPVESTTQTEEGVESTILSARENLYCTIDDAESLWTVTPVGSRLTTPRVSFSSPITAGSEFNGYSSVEVPTDDSFYYLRGNVEPTGSDVGIARWSLTGGAQRFYQDMTTKDALGLSVLFSGYSSENSREADLLFAGVLLGLIASLTIEIVFGLLPRWIGHWRGSSASTDSIQN